MTSWHRQQYVFSVPQLVGKYLGCRVCCHPLCDILRRAREGAVKRCSKSNITIYSGVRLQRYVQKRHSANNIRVNNWVENQPAHWPTERPTECWIPQCRVFSGVRFLNWLSTTPPAAFEYFFSVLPYPQKLHNWPPSEPAQPNPRIISHFPKIRAQY
jgi:hypothetical protein